MTPSEPNGIRSADDARIEQALVRAVRQEMAKHKRLGLPIAVWRDGKAVWLPAELIPVGIEEYEHPLSRPPADDGTPVR